MSQSQVTGKREDNQVCIILDDEQGEFVRRSAKAVGLSPETYVNSYIAMTRKTLPELAILVGAIPHEEIIKASLKTTDFVMNKIFGGRVS